MIKYRFFLPTAAALLLTISACTSGVPAASTANVTSPTPAASARPSPSDMIPRITVQDLYKKMQAGADVLIIDGRAGVETEYEAGHIKGAVPVSLSQFTEGWEPKVDPGTEIVIYCT
jgi:hypothetical protein